MQELEDIATRHQVYLERLKAGEVAATDPLFLRLDSEVTAALNKIRVSDLSMLALLQRAQLIKDIQEGHTAAYAEHLKRLADLLRDLMPVERDFEVDAINAVTVEELEADHNGLAPVTLWSSVQERPMLETGILLSAFLGNWMANEVNRAVGLIRKAIAEGWTPSDLQAAFRGTADQGGLYSSAKRNTATVINTIIQHASTTARHETMAAVILRPKGSARSTRPSGGDSSNAKDAIRVDAEGNVTRIPQAARDAAKRAGVAVGDNLKLTGYRWVAILDSKTSQICRSLDSQVFRFGEGPLPPQHPNCRSTIIAELLGKFHRRDAKGRFTADTRVKSGGVPVRTSYYDWLKDQPEEFQNDALGVTRAELFRKGGLSAEAFARLNLGRNFKPLTLDEMRRLAPNAFRRAGI